MDKTRQNMQIFEEVLFFQATENIKTNNSLSFGQFDAGRLDHTDISFVNWFVVQSLEKEGFLENLHVLPTYKAFSLASCVFQICPMFHTIAHTHTHTHAHTQIRSHTDCMTQPVNGQCTWSVILVTRPGLCGTIPACQSISPSQQ